MNSRRRLLTWSTLGLSIAVSPIAIAAVGVICERHTPLLSLGDQPRPSPVVLVDVLFAAHLVISATVAFVVPRVDQGWGRWLMWPAISGSIPMTWLVGVGANMATTGTYP